MENTTEYENFNENRKYKDTLFRFVFKEKEDLLALYNAVNGTSYTDAKDMEINTLENVLYISYKNDVSFLISDTINLYEHQSTFNANMPLRGLLYLSKLLDKYVTENGLNILSRKLQKIPTPQYIVFYNGTENEPDERIMRLSDAFIKKGACLECEARLLNINYGHNWELMERCRKLEEYALFVSCVRKHTEREQSFKKAINLAIDECIGNGILQEILIRNRSEVLGMVLTTFNKELYEKDLKEDAYEDGVAAGIEAGERKKLLEQIRAKLEKGKSVEEIADALEESEETIRNLLAELETV